MSNLMDRLQKLFIVFLLPIVDDPFWEEALDGIQLNAPTAADLADTIKVIEDGCGHLGKRENFFGYCDFSCNWKAATTESLSACCVPVPRTGTNNVKCHPV